MLFYFGGQVVMGDCYAFFLGGVAGVDPSRRIAYPGRDAVLTPAGRDALEPSL